MSTHTGTFPIYQDATGDVGVSVVYPYVVDVRGEGYEPTVQRIAEVTVTWHSVGADDEATKVVLAGLDREALEMLADAVRFGLAYLDRVQPVEGDEAT